MRLRMIFAAVLWLAAGLLGGCAGNPAATESGAVEPAATRTATGPSPATAPDATLEPSPTVKPSQAFAPPSPTPPATATAAPSVAPSATPEAVGLPCPDEPPQKPEYARAVLGEKPWPTPDAGAPRPAFWPGRPLPAGEPLQFNEGYPYGSDGSGRYLLHTGADMDGGLGTPVLAVAGGVVAVAGPDADRLYGWRCDWYGQLVVIELDERVDGRPVYVLYGHVLDILVEESERVEQGDAVAEVGVGGASIVPHLHLEVRVGENSFDATRNPNLRLRPDPGFGVVAGRLVDPVGRPWQGALVTLIDRSGRLPFSNTWTYLDDPQNLIKPDEALAENFVFGRVAAGEYDVYAAVQGVEYRLPLTVREGEIATVEIVTELYKTPTPEPGPTP